METVTFQDRERFRALGRDQIEALQSERLGKLGAQLGQNGFYREHHRGLPALTDLSSLAAFPLIDKTDLLRAVGTECDFHTFQPQDYVRLHRTSGTGGKPLIVMDTAEDWTWWIETWQYVLDAAAVKPGDRAFMAFSFGPFIGFWSAYDALHTRGAMVVPGGGLSTVGRLALLADSEATILCCTPTYALHLAQVASKEGVDLAATSIRAIIVAGEPGGSIPEVRQRLEDAWGAEVIDHSGATEIGPWGVGTPDGKSLYVIETEFVAEFLRSDGSRADEGELSELVLTNLRRMGAPVIRYRTGDLVRPRFTHDDDCRFVRLEGGVLGRADDMVVIRGVNIFPSSIESVIRSFPELGEFRIVVSKSGEMDQLHVQVEDPRNNPERIEKAFQTAIGIRVSLEVLAENTLERFEAKSRRLIDRR